MVYLFVAHLHINSERKCSCDAYKKYEIYQNQLGHKCELKNCTVIQSIVKFKPSCGQCILIPPIN